MYYRTYVPGRLQLRKTLITLTLIWLSANLQESSSLFQQTLNRCIEFKKKRGHATELTLTGVILLLNRCQMTTTKAYCQLLNYCHVTKTR